ncbi:MAG: S1C family serine protease [Gemmataceae bacterium]|nr:S1C family serine protease [Gemmataceae bacterium]MDW8242693.1 trypsin-like peptidase domain-containing protein [Thermogemmata sp.]
MVHSLRKRFLQVWLGIVAGTMLFPLTSSVGADTPSWPIDRVDFPNDVAELRALQTRVQQVVEKCTPLTVCVLIDFGAGSGVIVREDGLVLTAAHVISGEGPMGRLGPYKAGRKCKVMLWDGRLVNAKTLGINPSTDAGMVQITDPGPIDGKWPVAPLGKSQQLRRGQWVVALGHPGGPKDKRPPVARLGRVENLTNDLIRTNCALVGGDSGGPLFDLEGRVVGIHSRIGFTLNQNIHIPIEKFLTDWQRLEGGEVAGRANQRGQPFLGVVFPEDDEDDAWITEDVDPSTPAGKAGLKAGDTIVKFNGKTVKSVKQFRELMAQHRPGDEVQLTIRRGVTIMTLRVTLGRRQ